MKGSKTSSKKAGSSIIKVSEYMDTLLGLHDESYMYLVSASKLRRMMKRRFQDNDINLEDVEHVRSEFHKAYDRKYKAKSLSKAIARQERTKRYSKVERTPTIYNVRRNTQLKFGSVKHDIKVVKENGGQLAN